MKELKFNVDRSNTIDFHIKNSEHAAENLRVLFGDSIELFESMYALYLNRANKIIGWKQISQGGLSGTVLDIRLILKGALDCLGSSIIISHNHPSGNKQPSQADIKVTQKLKQACEIMDFELLDHIIVTSENYLSMGDEGLI